jgi:protein ImuB
MWERRLWERLQPRSSNKQPQLPTQPQLRIPDEPASIPQLHALWLCVHLPQLALEVHTRLASTTRPRVVIDAEDRLCRIVACDGRAAALGVYSGLALNTALGLAPRLESLVRDPRRERAALQRLAGWAGQFTPRVSLAPPEALLLEVRGSLALFGGVDALQCRVRKGIAELGYTAQLGVAPTPLAALWRSRAGEEQAVIEAHALAGQLGPIPLAHLRWPETVAKSMHEMGLRVIADCLRLPRDGFARRFGAERLADIDRALGRRPDPRPDYRPPTRFTAQLELPMAVQALDPLRHALALLLGELCGFLRARDGGIQVLQLSLVHHEIPVTQVSLELAQPQRASAHLLDLLMTRLERVALPAPVLSLRLRSGPVLCADPQAPELLGERTKQATSPPQLIERLRARLGSKAVHGLDPLPEHRPEAAWRLTEPDMGAASSRDLGPASRSRVQAAPAAMCDRDRPLWLLPTPRPLELTEGHPYLEGRLDLLRGPERIETGWWDGADVMRDYYVASNPQGVRLWIYRERRTPTAWYVQGFFG